MSKLPINHPNYWILYSTYGLLQLKKKNYISGLKMLKKALEDMEIKYDKSHIDLLKVELNYFFGLLFAGEIEKGK